MSPFDCFLRLHTPMTSTTPDSANTRTTDDTTTFGYIDDENGDLASGIFPILSPPTGWTQGSICTDCAFHLDPSKVFNGTWSDTTHYVYDPARTVQFNFTGTSLDVYCILPNPSDPDLTSTYNLTFSLDGQPLQQTFTHKSDLSNVYMYNISVLSLEGLTSISHVFTMLAASTFVNSSLLFDYARYSNAATSPAPSSKAHTSGLPIILSVVLGSILVLFIILLFLYRRYRRLRPQPNSEPLHFVEPYTHPQVTRFGSKSVHPGSFGSSEILEQPNPDDPPSYTKIDHV